LAEPGVKASREPLHAERRANVRKAAHQAAAPLRRNERRRGGDRRVAQRREPYLHERTGAAAPVLPDEENYGYPAAGRHKGWWLAGVLLLLAITGAVVALLASNPKQGMAIVNQGAEMIGLERQESELPKEAQFGTSVEELPYGGTPSVTREAQVVEPAPIRPNADPMHSSGAVAHAGEQNGAPAEPSVVADKAVPVKSEPERTENTEKSTKEPEEPKPAPKKTPAKEKTVEKTAAKAKPKPKPDALPQAVRSRELSRLLRQADEEGQ
jgi:hypothetical protein